MSSSKAWFAPKRFGYGAGLPIAWQGWAAIAIYAAVLISSYFALSGTSRMVVDLAATVAIVAVAIRTTKGGWRWRDGSDRDQDN